MNLLSFNEKFPDEISCRKYLKEKREEEGIICKECGGDHHYWIVSEERWKCAKCGTRVYLRAGTIMEHSKLSVRIWFMAIHLMTSTKKAFSALELQRQLGIKRYQPVWFMMQKIRKAMGKRDGQYQLKGEIEMDDAFFEIVDLPKKDELGNIIKDESLTDKNDEQKRGRGSQKQQEVLVIVESKDNPSQEAKHKKKRIMGFVKMFVMDKLSSEEINYIVKKHVSPESKISTDGFRGYSRLDNVVDEHTQLKVLAKEAHKKLPWVHTVIANAKRLFLGTHHSVNKDYLQNYLDEFCYKLNRRNFQSDLFDRMITAGVSDTWY